MIDIQPMRPSDEAALSQLYLADRLADFPWVKDPQLSDFARDSRHERVLVAWVDGEIAGFISLYRLANFIHLLFVSPQHRRQGVGAALIQAMRQEATNVLTLKCVMANDSALQFYAAEGFKIIKEDVAAHPANYTLVDTQREAYSVFRH